MVAAIVRRALATLAASGVAALTLPACAQTPQPPSSPATSDAPPSGLAGAIAAPAAAIAEARADIAGAKAEATAVMAKETFDPSDPWEHTNRKFYVVNGVIDKAAFRPLALGYKAVTPAPIRTSLRSAFSNLGEPLVFVNDLLQLKFGVAGRTFTRFAVNSTFGVAGLFDVGAKGGLPHHDNGFGLTLARYGTKPGPYVFLPVLGPSDVRDLVGAGVDIALNPFTWTRYPGDTAVGVVSTVVGGLDLRAEADPDLKALEAMSTDSYATLRSFYQQNRQSQVTGGQISVQSLPDFDEAPAPAAAASSPPAPAKPRGA